MIEEQRNLIIENKRKVGSLFDGSGTALLAATMCDMIPVWASEIEPYPIKVTSARFPGLVHLGDITKINGALIEPVDVICGGSPCQDLSIAGKQAGIYDGSRSHLFFEMIRVIKEMREATNGRYPTRVVWENVPNALSSNNGNDFYAVIESFSKIADPNVYVPQPKVKRGGSSTGNAVGKWLEITGALLGEQCQPNIGERPNEESDYMWLLHTAEYPNKPIVTNPKDILEQAVPDKYYLSAKGCQGRLNLATRRGGILPETLKTALQQIANQ